ncbi:hypothetical protein INN71_15580 [Nocardioides sp. ChNu-153]|uniref:hypothetical protein n=1 Tax=Nocardioides sp. ChNu-153 TaxID=2779364 RepID=UPI00264EDE5A|nr:hypothetical protein [Nocardioides sp. ChNu-153]MDN7122811.1 hypothetical protein [Nocardioides sp. ChNu-153]
MSRTGPAYVLGAGLLGAGLLLVGALTGAAAVVVTGHDWGLPLVAAATAAVLWAVPTRRGTVVPFVVGWVAPVLLALRTRPEGDYLIQGNGRGYTLLGLTFAVALVGVVVLAAGGRVRRTPPADAPGSHPHG